MLKDLKEIVLRANLELKKRGLVLLTWGNVSAIDRNTGFIVIKPSGVSYDDMKAEDMVVVDILGKTIEGGRPSSDTPSHIEIYKAFPEIGGVAHTHSTFATAWAQSGMDLDCLGTTHADYFYGEVPCLRGLTAEEIKTDYEKNTGKVIVSAFKDINRNPLSCPAALLKSHGPFTWGATADAAVENAVVLEEAAKMAFLARTLNNKLQPVEKALQDKHYFRKHGEGAYYGAKK